MCGIGVGIALAVGLKYASDSANSSCDDKVGKEINPYRAAIEVSRDLLERIKVGTEVGLSAAGLMIERVAADVCVTPVPPVLLYVLSG